LGERHHSVVTPLTAEDHATAHAEHIPNRRGASMLSGGSVYYSHVIQSRVSTG